MRRTRRVIHILTGATNILANERVSTLGTSIILVTQDMPTSTHVEIRDLSNQVTEENVLCSPQPNDGENLYFSSELEMPQVEELFTKCPRLLAQNLRSHGPARGSTLIITIHLFFVCHLQQNEFIIITLSF